MFLPAGDQRNPLYAGWQDPLDVVSEHWPKLRLSSHLNWTTTPCLQRPANLRIPSSRIDIVAMIGGPLRWTAEDWSGCRQGVVVQFRCELSRSFGQCSLTTVERILPSLAYKAVPLVAGGKKHFSRPRQSPRRRRPSYRGRRWRAWSKISCGGRRSCGRSSSDPTVIRNRRRIES